MYRKTFPSKKLEAFRGVRPQNVKTMNYICKTLKKAVNVYAPKKASNGKHACVYRCVKAGVDIFNKEKYQEVNLYYFNGRYSYIKDINRLKGEYDCSICQTYYFSPNYLNKHRKFFHPLHQNLIRPKTGYYRPRIFLKQMLREKGIPEYLLDKVNLKDFLCYDIEACLLNKKIDCDFLENEDSRESYLLQKHKTACIALMSNFSKVQIFNVLDYNATASIDVIFRFVKAAILLARKIKRRYLKENKLLVDYLVDIKEKAIGNKSRLLYIDKILTKIFQYAKGVPILGYNSARYDTQVLRYDGFFIVLNQLDPPIKIIKKGGFLKISTPHLIWLDALKYLGGGFSLRRFIKSFAPEIKQRKSYFPYEAFNKLEKLDNNYFPFYHMFESRLNGCNTLEDEYNPYLELLNNGFSTIEACKELKLDKIPLNGKQTYRKLKKIWKKRKMKTWRDYLNYYVYLDVFPFKIALKNMLEYFHKKDVDLFKSHCSISSAAVHMLFQSVEGEKAQFFYLDTENYEHIRRTVNGGLVTCNQRYFDCSGETRIKEYVYGDAALFGKIINCYDVNGLYGGILGFIRHLVGPYVQRDSKDGYSLKWCYENLPNSTKNPGCYTWLTAVAIEYHRSYGCELNIQSAYSTGERAILVSSGTRYKVDGYVSVQPHNRRPLVLEYLGCMHHAHKSGECLLKGYKPEEFHPLKVNKDNAKMLNGEVFQETLTRLAEIREYGYEVQTIWECEWLDRMKKFPKASDLIQEHLIPGITKTLGVKTETDMLKAIENGDVYGVAFVSVEVPEHLKRTVFEYPPVFKKVSNFTMEHLPENSFMKQYCLKHNMKPGKEFLTSFLAGDNLVLPTEYVRHMIEEGYLVTNLTRVLQFGNTNDKPFQKFVDTMVNDRREGAAKGDAISANMSKLILNAAVGFSLMKTNLLPDTIICEEKKAKKMLRLKRNVTVYEYLGPTKVDEEYFKGVKLKEMFLVAMEKTHASKISNMPILLGWKVLSMAKLQMLLYMAMARKYFDDTKWMFLYSDTDSMICVLSEPDIDDCVIESLKEEWRARKRDFFVTNEVGVCDNFTPLRLKIEASGDKFACITAKMYCIAGTNKEIIKSAQKGVKLSLNRELINFEKYKRIILDKNLPPNNSEHVGFVSSYQNDGFWTVQNEKRSFTGLYFKRLVAENGYWTQPLDWEHKFQC